ncbi:hypothetical protein BpHYR1_044953 [Brachionus plicatilis]|uniref:Uncharacterized protein n=1 Tax=Brachionus plicatilis TaxID=10195 RepID=A0A3M7S075_BRAPC|nr:hypothetical protein BpHYR1_044953 [Brachionus plicatilis]
MQIEQSYRILGIGAVVVVVVAEVVVQRIVVAVVVVVVVVEQHGPDEVGAADRAADFAVDFGADGAGPVNLVEFCLMVLDGTDETFCELELTWLNLAAEAGVILI